MPKKNPYTILTRVTFLFLNMFPSPGYRTILKKKILGIFWPYTISNGDLYERARESPISETLKVRRWRWIGHVLRREKDNNCRVALTWTPEGKRKRRRPKTTWRNTIERERKELGWTTWNVVEQVAKDRE